MMQKSKVPSILLVENVHPIAKSRLEESGYKVELISGSPEESELCAMLKAYDYLGIRSKTQVTEKVLQAGKHLQAIGCFCIGTNQVDLVGANRLGIPVFNAPYSNTRSVAELVISEIIALARQWSDRSRLAHEGGWMKIADGSREVRGKTLGIVGYGHIGSQVSVMAESMGLQVLFFDVMKKLPLGNAKSVSQLRELLESSDFVTLHVPETAETKDMISSRELNWMKKGSHLINASRGTVVVIKDLVDALKKKHLAGCAIDVFPTEPANNKEVFKSELQGLPNVILTPHIGGSTEEAQYSIGLEVAESFTQFIQMGATTGAVNFPVVEPQNLARGDGRVHRIANVHRNEPGVLGEVNSLVSKAGANIRAQYLSTDSSIGYLVMDLEIHDASQLGHDIGALSRSIKTRMIG